MSYDIKMMVLHINNNNNINVCLTINKFQYVRIMNIDMLWNALDTNAHSSL